MPKLTRLTLFLLLLGFAIPGTVTYGQTRTEGKVTVKGREVSMVLMEPNEPVALGEVATKLTQEDWAASYLKCQIRSAANYEEWCANVSDEYRALIAPTLEKFTETRSRNSPMKKEGHLLYWVTATSKDIEMLYLVEHARFKEDMPFGNTIKTFKKVRGSWRVHTHDELGLLGVVGVSDLPKLKSALISR